MSLTPGTRLGSYQVTAPLGQGGMGEVYRATDTTLGRSVAIKILPESFAFDSERLARFEREARTLASLNHPNIAQVFGYENVNGVRALIMELVEGPTLADRIAEGPIPTDEALAIARQIATALEVAHDAGIVHRDLKPANVKVRPDGTVKVLDFGLAKSVEPSGAGSADALSPTITSPALVTGAGVLLGTAGYMSPEQARGKAVDKRADIWAFGAVLYEMLTGDRPFQGETNLDVLAQVVHRIRTSHGSPRTCSRCSADAWRRIPNGASVTSRAWSCFSSSRLLSHRHVPGSASRPGWSPVSSPSRWWRSRWHSGPGPDSSDRLHGSRSTRRPTQRSRSSFPGRRFRATGACWSSRLKARGSRCCGCGRWIRSMRMSCQVPKTAIIHSGLQTRSRLASGPGQSDG